MSGKRLYWHLVTWVHPDGHGRLSVGDIVGYPEKHISRFGFDAKTKDVCVTTRLLYLGSLPENYREQYPTEAAARLSLWKQRAISKISDSCQEDG